MHIMSHRSVGLKILLFITSLLTVSCSGGGSGAIDQLFGGFSSAPILTSIPDQIVSQDKLVTIDVNNIKEGLPGSDEKMTYVCTFDSDIDGKVDAGQPCTSLPNSTVTFGGASGTLEVTPHTGILGNYEFKISGTNTDGQYSEIFTLGIRLSFDGIDQYTAITGTSVAMTWVPNAAAIGYQIFRLNSGTGLYELFHTVTGGSNSGTTITGLSPNTPYTFRAQAMDALGNLDGNVVSRSCTTTTLTRFTLTPATSTRAAGAPVSITVSAFNTDGSPQTVGGISLTPVILSGTSTGVFSAVTDNNNGTYSFTYTPQVVGTPVSIGLTTNLTFFLNNTADVTVVPGAPSSANSTLTIGSNTVISGQSVAASATIRDAYNNPILSGSTIAFNQSGGTSTGTFSAVSNAGGGVYNSNYTGIVAGTAKNVTVLVDGVALSLSVSVQVIPGTPVSATSTMTISAGTVSSGNAVSISATLRDINSNPVPSGILVAFSKSGGTSTGSFDAIANAGNGVYTINYTGLISGTAQTITVSVDGVTLTPTVTIQVVPGAPVLANSLLTVSSPTVTSGAFVNVSATLRDVNNNAIESGVNVSFTKTGGTSTGTFNSVTNAGLGVYNVRYTGVVAGSAQNLKVLVNGVDLGLNVTISVLPGAASPVTSTISISTANVVSGQAATVTATIRDANSNPISSGILVGFSKTAGTSTGNFASVTNAGNGVYTTTYTGVVSGSAQTIGIDVDSIALGVTSQITVVPGAVNIANSSLSVASPTVVSGTFVNISATLRDVNNNPIDPTQTVTFTKTGGTSTGTFNTVTNAGGGVYEIRYTGVVAGTAQNIKVLIGGVDVGFNVTLQVLPGAAAPATSTLAVSSSNVISGQSVTVTATVRDANGNPIPSGISVSISKTGGTSTGNFGTVTNAGAGIYTNTYTGVTSGSAQTLAIEVDGIPLGVTSSITVVPGAPSVLLSSFTVSSSTVIAGQSATLTGTIRDANGNPISTGLTVTFAKSGGTSNGTISAVTNQGSGVYTATYSGTTAGTANTFQVYANMGAVGTSQNIQVLVGAPVASHSTLTVTSSPLASGSNATISALVRDAYNNPITTEYAITFDTIGGSSTGNISAVNNLGSGNFQVTYSGSVAGSAQTVRVLADGTPISGLTSTIQVIPGAVDAANSTFQISNSVVQSGTTANITMNLRDGNNNAITSGLTIAFNKTAGVSDGTIGAVSNLGSGNYSAIFTATTQGAAQTITLVVNSVIISALNTSVTVTAGPPDHMSISGPTNPRNSIDCNGPYTVTLQDVSNNTTSSLSSFTVGFSSSPANAVVDTMFSDSSCTSTTTGLTFAPLVTTQSFYYKSYIPQNFTLTLTPSNTVTVANLPIQNIAVISWLGTALNFTMAGTGATTVTDDSSGALWQPYSSAHYNGFLFTADGSGGRILKYNLSNSTFVGWIGHIGSLDGISATCSSNVIGDLTPGWCTGGRSAPGTTTIVNAPRGIVVDSTYVYVASSSRILRFRQDTGAYQGWIGRVSTTIPPTTGQLATCTGQAINVRTPGWCTGGTFTSGNGDGMFNTPTDMAVVGTKLYVVDSGNDRIQKFDLSSGAYEGWVGRIGTQPTSPASCAAETIGNPTPTWCMGGTASTSNRYQLAGPPSEVAAPPEGFNNPQSIDGDSTYLYVADYANRRIVRLDTTTGAFSGWIGRVHRNSAMSPVTPSVTSGNYTHTWVQGGVTNESGGTTGFCAITSVKLDGGKLYTVDTCHKFNRVDAVDGQDYRWIGRVTTSPTGGYTGCSSTPVSGVTPGWCVGGAGNRAGNTNSALYNPFSVESDSNYFYVTDRDNFRIQKIEKTNGTFAGWIGGASAQATRWSRNPATSYTRSGIDDYSFWDMTSGYTAVGLNTDFMFVPDPGMHRIKKYNRRDGSAVGYIGQINVFPPTGPDTCVGYTSGMTPDWCSGGGRTTSGSGIHGYNAPYSLAADDTYVYIVNVTNQRIDRVRISDALYMGWIGRVNAVPTDGDNACTQPSVVAGVASPTWCIGGTAQTGTSFGMLNTPRGIYYDTAIQKLFAVDDGRLIRIDPATGAFEATIGHLTAGAGGCTIMNSTVADSWCTTSSTGGNGTNNYGGLNDGSAIATDATYIYVVDSGNHRIHRFTKSGGVPAGIIGRLNNTTNLNTNAVTGGGCASITTGYPRVAPGWCFGTSIGAALSVPAATAEEGAFNTPRGIYADGTYLYITDSMNNRLVRINASSGAFAGWKGYIASTAGMSDSDCIAAGSTTGITPKWCFGGTAGPAKRLGGFDYPAGLTGDANYLYVHDGRNNRIVTIPK